MAVITVALLMGAAGLLIIGATVIVLRLFEPDDTEDE
jgi:hypothetical protein